MSTPPVRLRLEASSTELEFDGGRVVTLQVGPRALVDTVLRSDPPTPAQLERAIDRVEDALMASRVARADAGVLMTTDALLLTLPGFGARGCEFTREAVEALFQRLASRALSTPVPATDLPEGRDIAAALLILRECMHHLGFDQVAVG